MTSDLYTHLHRCMYLHVHTSVPWWQDRIDKSYNLMYIQKKNLIIKDYYFSSISQTESSVSALFCLQGHQDDLATYLWLLKLRTLDESLLLPLPKPI